MFTKQYVVSLTEEELARHNNNVPPLSILSYQEDVREEEDYEFAFDEREFLKRLDERCNDIQRDIDEKFKVMTKLGKSMLINVLYSGWKNSLPKQKKSFINPNVILKN